MSIARGCGSCIVLVALSLAVACGSSDQRALTAALRSYVDAANRHDLAALGQMVTEDVAWYLGPDTLRGRQAVLAPHAFDSGANTVLLVDQVEVRGDTVEFDLVEHNDVLDALGIGELHHYPRFVFRDGLIAEIRARRQPLELDAFSDSVASFMQWLGQHDPTAFARLWPDGRFAYSTEAGTEMPALVLEWRRRDGATPGD